MRRYYLLIFASLFAVGSLMMAADASAVTKAGSPVTVASASININTADVDHLAAVKGLGPKRAQAIIDYRQQHGDFQSVDDLSHVKGIGPSLLSKISPQLSVGK